MFGSYSSSTLSGMNEIGAYLVVDMSDLQSDLFLPILLLKLSLSHVLVLDIVIELFHVLLTLEITIVSSDNDIGTLSLDSLHVVVHVSLVLHPPEIRFD